MYDQFAMKLMKLKSDPKFLHTCMVETPHSSCTTLHGKQLTYSLQLVVCHRYRPLQYYQSSARGAKDARTWVHYVTCG